MALWRPRASSGSRVRCLLVTTNPADCAHRFGRFVAPLGRVHRGSVLSIHPGHKLFNIHFQSRHPHHDFHGKPCSQTNTTDRIVTGGPVCRKRPSKSGSLLSSNQSFRCKLVPPTPGMACDWQVLGGETTARSHDQVLPSILPHHGSSAA